MLMPKNDVPRSVRIIVMKRANMRCERCGTGTNPGQIHHRRSRSVHDLHTHCPCNCVLLCTTCHRDIHATPFSSRGEGFIVSRYADPTRAPFQRWDTAWVYPTCEGTVGFLEFTEEETQEPS